MKRYEALNSAFGRTWSLGEWAVDSFKKKLRRKGNIIVVSRYEKFRAWLNEDIDEIRHDKKGVCNG